MRLVAKTKVRSQRRHLSNQSPQEKVIISIQQTPQIRIQEKIKILILREENIWLAETRENMSLFSYLHITSSPPKPLSKQSQRVNGALWLRWIPSNLCKCFSYPWTIKPQYVVPCPYPSYIINQLKERQHNWTKARPFLTFFHLKSRTFVSTRTCTKRKLGSLQKTKVPTMEDIVDGVGDLCKRRFRFDVLSLDAVALDRPRRDVAEISGSNEGCVASKLH